MSISIKTITPKFINYKLDIAINDDVVEEVFGKSVYPNDFVSFIRHKKLEKIIP